jgi:hypothetical protein
VVSVAAALVGAAPAAAWQQAESLTPGATGYGEVAYTSSGEVLVGWVALAPNGAVSPMKSYLAVKRPGEPVGTPTLIESTSSGASPQLAADGAGNAIAAWSAYGGNRITVVRRPASGSFGDPEPLPISGSGVIDAVANRAGDVAIVYYRDGSRAIDAVFGTTTGGFGPPVTVTDNAGDYAADIQATLSDSGELAVAWVARSGYYLPGPVQAAIRTAIGPQPPVQTLSDPAHTALTMSLGMTAGGDAAITWDEERHFLASERIGGGSFGAPHEVGLPAVNIRTAVASDGTMTYAAARLIFSGRIGGGTPARQMDLPSGFFGFDAPIATSRAGHTLIALHSDPDHGATIARQGSGPFSPPDDLRPDCDHVDYVRVAVSDAGEGAALIQRRGELVLAVDPAGDGDRYQCADTRWSAPMPDPPAGAPTPGASALNLRITRVKIGRGRTARNASLTVSCGTTCKVDTRATLRVKGGATLSRAHTAKDAAGGRAVLKLKLKLSRSAQRKLAAKRRPLLELVLSLKASTPQGASRHQTLKRTVR